MDRTRKPKADTVKIGEANVAATKATTSSVAPSLAGPEPAPPAEAGTRPGREDTVVTAWLRRHYAAAFVEAFHSEGYYELCDVDDAAIDRIVTEKGSANRLKADLKQRSLGAMVPPDLPPGTTLDLSRPTVTSASGVTFTVPTTLSVRRTEDAIQSPSALQNGDWVVIARNAAILYGFRMDGPAPVRARRPVLEWVVPERIDFARSEMYQARVESSVVYTEETAAYVRCGFDKETATAGFPFCAASFERSRKERTARAAAHKELHQVGMWKYPRATLFLDECTKASAAFTEAVEKALAMIDPREALRQLLLDYGHAIPVEVTLGGQLHFDHVRIEDAATSERQVEQETKAAVEAKYQGFSASAGVAMGTSTSHSAASVEVAEQTSFDALGGDTTLVSNPAEWASTVKDPRLWAVIGNARMCSPLDLLSPELQARVLSHWDPPLYPELPAIDEPLEVPADTAGRATSAGFLLAFADCAGTAPKSWEGARPALVSGAQDLEGDEANAAVAEAIAFSVHASDMWIDVGGACLPVAAGAGYGAWFLAPKTYAIQSRRRLGFARSRFDFGAWRPFTLGEPVKAEEDGFLVVRARKNKAQVGCVEVSVDDALLTGVAVDDSIDTASACVPVRAGELIAAKVSLTDVNGVAVRGTDPAVLATARWIPLGPGWSLGPRVAVEPNTHLTAETDGVLHALLDAVVNTRGVVRLYAAGVDPWIGTSVHVFAPHHRLIRYGAALLPVGKGATYFASLTPSAGVPRLSLTWTPIVRRR